MSGDHSKPWIILDRGDVPESAATIPYTCPCGHEAELPVKGRPVAELSGGGILFDNDERGALPTAIKCRRCGRILTTGEDSHVR